MTDDIVKSMIAVLQLVGVFFKREKEPVAIAQTDRVATVPPEPFWDTEKLAVLFLGLVAVVSVLGLVSMLSAKKALV